MNRSFKRAVLCPMLGWALVTGSLLQHAGADVLSELFRVQYQVADSSFTNAQTSVDYFGDGTRQLLFASRNTKQLQMRDAADGAVRWSRTLTGDSQSLSAYDLDGDGANEILYTTSSPGRLYVLNRNGTVLDYWETDDWKLGSSPVILDGDGDGVLDGYLGTRTNYLVRLNMEDLTEITRRSFQQCGAYASAMDVDRDGIWDLFAGAGDDGQVKGTVHRYDPVTLESVWSYFTNDNASSADSVLVDIDGDGQVEVIKSVDNYGGDDPHDAVYAFETDGTMLWKVDGISGEDSPNVADLDGDGEVEIVGMTFGGVVYSLDPTGHFNWQKDLRPELSDSAHAYMAPILADVDGDKELEILVMTNGGYTGTGREGNGILFALDATGQILDSIDLGEHRYWGNAYYANVDEDPFMELVLSGSGGLDVIETKGYGPNTEDFQRRRDYRRLNVVPWAYEDSYFIYSGQKDGVVNWTDNLVLEQIAGEYVASGSFTTELLTLPPEGFFTSIVYDPVVPDGTSLTLDILSEDGDPILEDATSGQSFRIDQSVQLQFNFGTTDPLLTPILYSYQLEFDAEPPAVPTRFSWNVAGLGIWDRDSNWEPRDYRVGPPHGDNEAVFGDVAGRAAPSSVIVDSDVTVASIQFDSPFTYAIVGVGGVNLAAGETHFPSAGIGVQQGDHQFQVVVNLQSDTAANVANDATLTFNNALNLGDYNLTLTGPGEVVINNDLTGSGMIIMQNGVLSGGGSIDGDVANLGGTIAPGNSPGRMVIKGDLIQAEDGNLSIELAGTAAGSEHDVLQVDGLVSLGGALEVSLLDGFEPTAGDTFDILDFGSLTGRFDEIQLPELADGKGWNVSALHSDGTISVVPEPHTLLLLLAGGIAASVAARPCKKRAKDTDLVGEEYAKHEDSW